MTLDPVKKKNEILEENIAHLLKNEEGWTREVLVLLRGYLDRRSLKLRSIYEYLRWARLILQHLERHPREWTAKDIPRALDRWAEHSLTARNTARAVIRHMLRAFKRPQLLRISKYSPEEATSPEEMLVAQSMKSERLSTGLRQMVSPEWEEITEMHVRALTSQAHPNLAAMLWVLWDTGARPDDLSTLKLRDIKEYGNHIVLIIEEDTKTGSRPVPLNYSLGVFRRYLATHPYRERDAGGRYVNADVAVFLNTRGEAWTSTALNCAFRRVRDRVREQEKKGDWPFPRLPRDITLQRLRPNAVSRDRESGMTADENAMIRGHDPAVMREFYDHADKAVMALKAVTRIHGREWEEEERTHEPWIDCPKCHVPNPPAVDYCSNCGDPISPIAIREVEQRRRNQEDEATAEYHDLLKEKARMERRIRELEGKLKSQGMEELISR